MKEKLIIAMGILVSGLLGIIIYPTVAFGTRLPDAGFLAWFFLLPLLIVLYIQENNLSRFVISLCCGFIMYLGSLYWFAVAMTGFGGVSLWAGLAVLCLIAIILASLFAATVTFSFWVFDKTKIPLSLVLAVSLTALEFLRVYFPVGGFPWPAPVYSQGGYLLFFQWMDVTGVWGLNFLIYLINGLFAEMVWSWFGMHAIDQLLKRSVAMGFLMLFSFYASVLSQRGIKVSQPLEENVLSVALVQGNIKQDLKWNPQTAYDNLEKHLLMTQKATEQGAELVIWPETAYPYTIDLSESEKFILDENKLISEESTILFGAVSEDPTEELKIHNSAFLYSKSQQGLSSPYHKRHLVPFGEYVPLKKFLVFAKKLTQAVGDFTAGNSGSLLNFSNFKLGVLICYEDIFPALARQTVLGGADWLVNITNDAWYGTSSAIYQHMVFSQVRALENRRPLLRAANTGISAIIDARGSIVKVMPPFEDGVLIQTVALEKKNSFYTRFGDWFAWLCVVASALMLLKVKFSKSKNPV